MKLEHWFPTPIWFEQTSVSVEPIRRKCLELRDQGFENRVKSNRGGWQSDDIYFDKFLEFAEMENVIRDKLNEIAPLINPSLKLAPSNVWININKKGDFNAKHFHPCAAMSGVFYVSCNSLSGKVRFFPYNLQQHYPIDTTGSSIFYEHVTYTPSNGLLLIFPSWLEHEAETCQSTEDRISIAFNINQVS